MATYREAEDLLDKLAFYLSREALREKIGAAGRAEVLEKHTYRHRMERVLQEAEAALARVAVPVTAVRAHAQSPGWGGIVQPDLLTPGTTSASSPSFSSSPGLRGRAGW
jgi:hypothetical protein